MSWNEIWDERGREYPGDDPLAINGFDQGFGAIDNKTFIDVAGSLQKDLMLNHTDKVLDVGCGSGPYVNQLSSLTKSIIGIDLSQNMVDKAIKLYPHCSFRQAEPINLPFADASFTKVYCHSVFHYFRDNSYAECVFSVMLRVSVPGARIVLSDLMDVEKKAEYLEFRKSFSDSPKWTSSVEEPVAHLYYDKSFFKDLKMKFEQINSIIVKDRTVDGYKNSQFRFDVIITSRV